MGLRRRTLVRLAWVALVALGALAALDGWRFVRAARINAQIASGALPPESDDAPAQIRFAQAYAQAASGATDAALTRYGALQALQDDRSLGQAARYNAANLLLRQGLALREHAQSGQALALIELAKEGYREVLRSDAGDWAARYNLERAQRLVPDPAEEDEAAPDVRRNAERAATTMRGYAPGLP